MTRNTHSTPAKQRRSMQPGLPPPIVDCKTAPHNYDPSVCLYPGSVSGAYSRSDSVSTVVFMPELARITQMPCFIIHRQRKAGEKQPTSLKPSAVMHLPLSNYRFRKLLQQTCFQAVVPPPSTISGSIPCVVNHASSAISPLPSCCHLPATIAVGIRPAFRTEM